MCMPHVTMCTPNLTWRHWKWWHHPRLFYHFWEDIPHLQPALNSWPPYLRCQLPIQIQNCLSVGLLNELRRIRMYFVEKTPAYCYTNSLALRCEAFDLALKLMQLRRNHEVKNHHHCAPYTMGYTGTVVIGYFPVVFLTKVKLF